MISACITVSRPALGRCVILYTERISAVKVHDKCFVDWRPPRWDDDGRSQCGRIRRCLRCIAVRDNNNVQNMCTWDHTHIHIDHRSRLTLIDSGIISNHLNHTSAIWYYSVRDVRSLVFGELVRDGFGKKLITFIIIVTEIYRLEPPSIAGPEGPRMSLALEELCLLIRDHGYKCFSPLNILCEICTVIYVCIAILKSHYVVPP
jgi:hypothetical protein